MREGLASSLQPTEPVELKLEHPQLVLGVGQEHLEGLVRRHVEPPEVVRRLPLFLGRELFYGDGVHKSAEELREIRDIWSSFSNFAANSMKG